MFITFWEWRGVAPSILSPECKMAYKWVTAGLFVHPKRSDGNLRVLQLPETTGSAPCQLCAVPDGSDQISNPSVSGAVAVSFREGNHHWVY